MSCVMTTYHWRRIKNRNFSEKKKFVKNFEKFEEIAEI